MKWFFKKQKPCECKESTEEKSKKNQIEDVPKPKIYDLVLKINFKEGWPRSSAIWNIRPWDPSKKPTENNEMRNFIKWFFSERQYYLFVYGENYNQSYLLNRNYIINFEYNIVEVKNG